MTKITLTWQGDAQHKKPFDEEVEIGVTDLQSKTSINKVESVVIKKKSSENPFKLHKLERAGMIVALDDGMEQLSIIKFLLHEHVHPSWNNLYKYQPPEERFALTPKKLQKFQEDVYEKIPFTDLHKLSKEICFLLNILKELSREILQEGFYDSLLTLLDGLKKEEDDNERIEAYGVQREAELKKLERTLAKEKKELTKALEEARDHASKLKDDAEDVDIYGKQELRYTEDWEAARIYQNELRLTELEDVHNNIISSHLTKIEYENRIHNEIRNFIQENAEDLQESINYWMQHYDDEIDRRDSEIIHLKMVWEQLTEDHRVLRETYAEHSEFVVERRAYNVERARLAEIERIQTIAAIKIQAWWRGTMVRKKLGPFRPKKGKGKKDDKKGGKGGKKKK